MSPRKKIPRRFADLESEAQFVDKTFELAERTGWMYVQFTAAPIVRNGVVVGHRTHFKGKPGFPDAAFARWGEFFTVEFKRNDGRLEPDQVVWQRHIPSAQHRVWRPDDWLEVVSTLTAPPRRPSR